VTTPDDPAPIQAVVNPDPSEAARVQTRLFLRSPLGIAFVALVVVVCLPIAALGFWLIYARQQYIVGTFFAVFACALAVMWPLRFPAAMAKRIEKTLAAEPGERVLTFSTNGVDSKTPHSAAHVDWTAVKGARTVPEGLLLHIGRTNFFVSKRNFASQAEYERAVELIGGKIGARATFG